MPRVVSSLELKGNKDPGWSMLQRIYQQLAKLVNGGLSFGSGTQTDNISGVWVNITTSTVVTDFTITHNLGRIPAGYFIAQKNTPCDVYNGSVAPTTTTITLRSTAIATLRIFIF